MKDQIEPQALAIHHSPDVRSWPATVSITAIHETPSGGFELFFDRPIPDSWKWPSNPNVPSENFQYTVWFGARIAGAWHAAGFVQMWQGRDFKRSLPPLFQDVDGAPGYTRLWGDVRQLWGELSTYTPVPGDALIIFVTAGNGRLTDGVSSVAERSNIVLFPITANDSAIATYQDQEPPAMNNLDVVRRVKAELEAAGVDLAGPCGALQITNRVALALGAGLLQKATGNNCNGRAVDYIVFRGGPAVDILGDAGGANIPQWSEDTDPTLLARWAPPFPLEAGGGDPPPPGHTDPPSTPVDVLGRLQHLEQMVLALTDNQAAIETMNAKRFDLLMAAITKHPGYTGTVAIRYLGTGQIELTPKP